MAASGIKSAMEGSGASPVPPAGRRPSCCISTTPASKPAALGSPGRCPRRHVPDRLRGAAAPRARLGGRGGAQHAPADAGLAGRPLQRGEDRARRARPRARRPRGLSALRRRDRRAARPARRRRADRPAHRRGQRPRRPAPRPARQPAPAAARQRQGGPRAGLGLSPSAFPIERHRRLVARPGPRPSAWPPASRAEGHPPAASADPDPAGADIVSAATLSREPLLRGEAVRPGTHVDLVGAFRPDMREVRRRPRSPAPPSSSTPAPAPWPRPATSSRPSPRAPSSPATSRRSWPSSAAAAIPAGGTPQEITVFKSVGWAGEDLAAAVLAYEGTLAGEGRE